MTIKIKKSKLLQFVYNLIMQSEENKKVTFYG